LGKGFLHSRKRRASGKLRILLDNLLVMNK
jgi:hypothetical protein